MTPSNEEPKENYVDTMDELQCLVETVSEYLAEKEEEINRFGSLSKTKKTDKQNSTIDDAKQKMPKDQIPPLTITKDDKDKTLSFPELNGVKCAVGSLFSSLTGKVGSGTKHLTNSVEKLVYIVPEKTETVNQTETINLESRPSDNSVLEKDLSMQSSLSSQTVDDKDKHGRTSGNEHMGNKMGNLSFENVIETTERDSVPQSSVIKSVFSKLNPLKIFSEKEETKKDDQSKELRRESFVGCGTESNQREDTLDNHSGSITALNRKEGETRDQFQMQASEDLLSSQVANEPSSSASCASKKDENLFEGKTCVDLSLLPDHPKICAKDKPGHVCVSGSRPANKEASSKLLEKDKVTGDDDFLEPLRKSFSQFLFTSPEPCSKETLSESMKIDQVKEDGWESSPKKDGHSFSFSGKLHIPFFKVLSHSEKQQDLKEKVSIFPLFKFPFTDSHKVVNDQSFHDSAVTTDKEIQRNYQEEAKLSSVKSNSLPNIHNDLEKFGSTEEFNKNDQVHCSKDINLSSVRSSSVPNIHNDLGKFGSTEKFNKNEQIHCSEDAKLNIINADSASNIINNFGKFGSIEELNPNDHTAVKSYESGALPVPGVVSPKHKTSDLSGKALPRREGPLCLNLETFSQALEQSSLIQQDQPLDFSVYNPQKFKGDLLSSKERPCGSECTLDLRNQPQTISNHVLNRSQVTARGENQPLAKDSSVHLSSFQWLPSFSDEASSSVHPENLTKGLQQAEETPSVNKVTPFSVWGALVESTLNFDKSESPEALVMQKMDQQSKLAELTSDGLHPLILSKQLKSNSQKEEENQLKYSEKLTVSNVQQRDFTKNIRQGFSLNKSIPVKKQSLLKSDYQVSPTSQAKSSKEDDKIITADSVSDPPVPQFSRDEHKRCDLPQEQSSKEPEKTLFKSALKLFGREESSAGTMANEKQASRFLNLFKTQANKEESSNLEKSDGDKNGKTSSQEKKESSSVSNFFGTLGEFFKTNVSPIQTTENMPLSSANDKDEVKSSLNSVQLNSQGIGNVETPAAVSVEGKIRGRSLNKQATIDDSRLREPSIKETQDSNLNKKEKPFRDHLIQQSTEPSFSTSCLKNSPRDSSKETSDMSTVTEGPKSSKIPFDILSRRKSNELDHLPGKDWSFSTAATSPSQPEPPIRKSIFSFLNRSEKSENRASTALPRARSQAEGLFTLPSFFPTTNSSIKDTSCKKSSSFSFFSLSFLDEKQQTPVAPVTTQPYKKPSVFVDTIVSMTREGSSDHRDSIAQEVVHKQQLAPCISTSNTTEITSLADEYSEEKTQGKLSSSNEPEISLDFQVNQVQKDTVPPPSEFQSHAEMFFIDPETLEVTTPQKEEALSHKAFAGDSLAKSFSYDNHLNEKLNDLDACTECQNETFTTDPLNLPLEMVSDEVSPQIKEPAAASSDPGFEGHLQNRDADKKEDKSMLDSKVEMLSGFMTKVKSFSGCLTEPPKTFSGLFSSPKSPKKNSFLSFSSNASSQPLKGELFGIFKSSKPETYKQESSVATSWLQNGCSREAVGSIPPESLHRAASAGLNSDSTLSDCRMTVVSTMSELDGLTDDPKLTTKTEKNNVLENVSEPQGFETIATSSVSEDDMRQGVLSLSNEGDMGMQQGTDTEASLEAEHILLPTQLHPDPAWIAEELPPSTQPPLLEPELAIQTASTNQNVLEVQATNSLETNTTLFDEGNVNESTASETQGDLFHPLQEEPVLYAKEVCGVLNAQEDPPAVPQEMEQPRPLFEIPNMTNWPKLRFPSSTTDRGKTLSSFFSSPSPSGNKAVKSGLMSGFKKLSTLFEGGNEGSIPPSNSKPGFGKKLDLSFSWPKENKGDSEHVPGESSPPILIISNDLNSSEASKASESSQIPVASAQPDEVFTQSSGTSEQLDARPSVSVHVLSGPEEVKTQLEISASGELGGAQGNRSTCPSWKPEEEHCTVFELPNRPEKQEEEVLPASISASGELGGAQGNLSGSTCPSGKPEEQHCTVFELPNQPGKQEEEVLSASTNCVSSEQRPVITPDDIKEPMTNKRPVLNSSIINGFKELTIYDAGDLVLDYVSLLFILSVSFLTPVLHIN
ncbi:uncharacterized protein ACOB7L_008949 [Callospermophilus lateralis]